MYFGLTGRFLNRSNNTNLAKCNVGVSLQSFKFSAEPASDSFLRRVAVLPGEGDGQAFGSDCAKRK